MYGKKYFEVFFSVHGENEQIEVSSTSSILGARFDPVHETCKHIDNVYGAHYIHTIWGTEVTLHLSPSWAWPAEREHHTCVRARSCSGPVAMSCTPQWDSNLKPVGLHYYGGIVDDAEATQESHKITKSCFGTRTSAKKKVSQPAESYNENLPLI